MNWRGKSYEERIFRTGEVATRPGSWHDLFNALAWLAFPRAKAALNRLHHDELARRGDGPARGTVRDVATLFDRNRIASLRFLPRRVDCFVVERAGRSQGSFSGGYVHLRMRARRERRGATGAHFGGRERNEVIYIDSPIP